MAALSWNWLALAPSDVGETSGFSSQKSHLATKVLPCKPNTTGQKREGHMSPLCLLAKEMSAEFDGSDDLPKKSAHPT